ncbi:23S rRNA (guanosine(2251)-2'-O)-methyltransferase RlmB [Candidatus Gillettellia adelgis]
MSAIVYGIHTIKTLLELNPQCLLEVFILQGHQNARLQALLTELKGHGLAVQMKNRQWLNYKVQGAMHQGIIARIHETQQLQERDLLILLQNVNAPFLLVLDGVTDPHNLGACLRSANAAGVHAVIVPRNRSAQLNSTVKKVACGAAESIPLVRVTNLARTLRSLQAMNIWVIGTVSEATHTVYQCKMTGPIALVMGEESEGIRLLTRKHCDELLKIPMAGTISSLNVSVAAGICLFEAVRQRLCYTPKDSITKHYKKTKKEQS